MEYISRFFFYVLNSKQGDLIRSKLRCRRFDQSVSFRVEVADTVMVATGPCVGRSVWPFGRSWVDSWLTKVDFSTSSLKKKSL